MAFDHSHRRPASISSLPVEILVVIFSFVDDTGRVDRRLIPSRNLLPYSIASVCTLWREIAIVVPQLWIQLIVSLDPRSNSYTKLAELGNHLQWSRNLPFMLCVRPDDPWGINRQPHEGDDWEKSRLAVVVQTLLPHLHRCRALKISVRRSSSLPSFSTILSSISTCEKLEILRLDCSTHDACSEPCPVTSQAGPPSPPTGWQPAPLIELSLSADSIFLYKHLSDPSRFGAVRDLTLSNYDARVCPPGEYGLSVSCFIEMLGSATKAENISLTNLYFHIEDEFEVERFARRSPKSVYCEDLQADVVEAVCYLYEDCWMHSLTIIQCRIDLVEAFSAHELHLGSISEGSFPHEAFRTWGGLSLSVDECPLFDDSILRIAELTTPHGTYGCPALEELAIESCPNISVAALKSLVMRRWEKAREEFKWEDFQEMESHYFSCVAPITQLVVDEHITGLLSKADVTWFKSKLRRLYLFPLSETATSSSSSDKETDRGIDSDEETDFDNWEGSDCDEECQCGGHH